MADSPGNQASDHTGGGGGGGDGGVGDHHADAMSSSSHHLYYGGSPTDAAAAAFAPPPPTARALEICQGRKLIEETEEKLKQLERDHDRLVERASLLVDAERAWNRLSSHRRRDISTILLALQSPRRPSCMEWEQFDQHFSTWIRQDRDVLLARLQYVPGFEETYMHSPYPVPTRLRGDKQVMLQICKSNSQALSLATKALKDDRDVVMAAIMQNYHFAPCALQYASPKLRGDRRIARAALGREYGIRAFGYLSHKLKEDPKLAILAIRKSGDEYSAMNEHFSDLPELFREDEDVVLEAVKRRGSNLRYVTDQNLLRDYDVIYQACSSDGAALEFVPDCPAKKRMLKGNDLMMVLTRGGGQLLDDAPPEYQREPAYVLAAVENGYAAKSLANFYTTDRAFFFQLIAASINISEVYRQLPEAIQQNTDVILAVLQNDTINEALLCSMVKRGDFLANNKTALLEVVRRGCLSCLGQTPVRSLMDDKDFVLKACAIDGACMHYASSRLQKDVDCVRAALQSDEPISFDMIEAELPKQIWENEDILEMIIRTVADPDESHPTIRAKAPLTFLRSRKVYMACLETGWPNHALPYSVRVAFEDDEEVMLAALKYQNEHQTAGSIMYNHIGPTLSSSKEFFERAIVIDPRVLPYASRNIRFDYDLMLLAIGSNRNALQTTCHRSNGESMAKLVEFAAKARDRLAVGDSFVVDFLRGIAIPNNNNNNNIITTPPPKKRARRTTTRRGLTTTKVGNSINDNVCHLPMLDCGPETGMALKRLIGEFADVPMGREYKLLRHASDNLAFWGY